MHKVDINRYPHHMRRDYAIRNDNIDKGVKLCGRCGGTGNELMSMYKMCQACKGTGIHNPDWDYTKE
jgi:RecJ-like exonuclease